MEITIEKVVLTKDQAANIHLVDKSYLSGIKVTEDSIVLNAKRELTDAEIQEVKDSLSAINPPPKKDKKKAIKDASTLEELKDAILDIV